MSWAILSNTSKAFSIAVVLQSRAALWQLLLPLKDSLHNNRGVLHMLCISDHKYPNWSKCKLAPALYALFSLLPNVPTLFHRFWVFPHEENNLISNRNMFFSVLWCVPFTYIWFMLCSFMEEKESVHLRSNSAKTDNRLLCTT